VDEKTLRGTRELADDSGALVTMHLSESNFIIDEAQRRFGMRDIPFAEKIGLLGPDFLAAHCVKAQPEDIAILASTGASVSHNPCSNMYLGNGFAPVPAMSEAGIAVGLGTDGSASSSNMSVLQTIKFAALIHKGVHQDPEVMTAERALEMATIQGARAIGKDDEIGSIERGKRADIIVLDATNYCITPLHRAPSALVYSARGDEVQRVYVDGQEVVSGGEVRTVNGADVRRAAKLCADALTERAGTAYLGRRAWRSAL
jgi:5-methylthioadenosine/S-adenosylhomocysteine deaminase